MICSLTFKEFDLDDIGFKVGLSYNLKNIRCLQWVCVA